MRLIIERLFLSQGLIRSTNIEWLNQFFTSISKFFPVLWSVEPDESGIRTTLGKHVKDTPPGWYLLWRLIQVAEKIKVVPQVIDLRGQSITTRDGKSILISGAVQYRVTNARKAILEVYDYDSNLQNVALGVLARYAAAHTYDECRSTTALEKEVLEGVRDAASGWGLKVMRCFVTDLCESRCIRVVGDSIVPLEA